MSEKQNVEASGLNRAKPYQLVLFPLNNGATNVYYVLVLSYIATFGSNVLALGLMFASIMVTAMRLCDAITDPIIGALIDRTNGKFGKFRPFMVIGNLIMAVSIILLYIVTPYIPADMMPLRYVVFVLLYFVWVIGYTFQTSCTRSGQTVLTNDPKQRPLFTIFNTVGSLVGMGVMQFVAPILRANVADYSSADFYRVLTPIGVVISIVLTLLAVIGIWEKDQPKYFGVGGEKQKKVKVSEYIEIIKNNKPMQRLMIAGAGCKLALSIATNTTVLCLGEYGALAAAGVMELPDLFRIIRMRGIYMQEAYPEGGAMAAILGLDGDTVAKICGQTAKETGKVVSVANYNCPGQIVITGEADAVAAASEALKEAGAKRCIPLKVSGPFHSALLKNAGEQLAEELKSVKLSTPWIPYVSNVTADYVTDASQVAELLKQQVSSPVHFTQSIERMIADGVDTFIEIGPGKTLGSFVRKIDRNVKVYNIEKPEDLDRVMEELAC